MAVQQQIAKSSQCRAITEDAHHATNGEQYPVGPPTVEEIIAVMQTVGDHPHGEPPCALITLLWRAGLRVSEALALQESDLDRSRSAVPTDTRRAR